MKKKLLTSTTILLLLLTLTTTVFAYWAGAFTNATKDTSGKVTIGEGEVVETKLVLGDLDTAGVLVPVGRATVGQVESITVSIDIEWLALDDKDMTGATGDLVITLVSKSDALLQITLPASQVITSGTTLTVSIVITLDEPSDKTEYDRVANAELDFTLSFTVTPHNT